MKAVGKILDHLEEWLISILIASATLLIFFAVIHRYGSSSSIALSKWAAAREITWLAAIGKTVFDRLIAIDVSWAQELCIYMFVWMAKFGAAYGVRTGIHVGVDVALQQLAPGSRYRVILFGLTCGALFTGTIAAFGANFVHHIYNTGQVSNDLEVPMWMVYLAIPVGSGLMSFRFLQVALQFFVKGELPHTDESHVEGISVDHAAPALPANAATGGAR